MATEGHNEGTEAEELRFHALLRLAGPGLEQRLADLLADADARYQAARDWNAAARREREGVRWCCEQLSAAVAGDALYWVAPRLDLYRAHGLWKLFLTRFPPGYEGRLELRHSVSPAAVPGAQALYEVLLTRELLRGAAWPLRLLPDGRYVTERPIRAGRP